MGHINSCWGALQQPFIYEKTEELVIVHWKDYKMNFLVARQWRILEDAETMKRKKYAKRLQQRLGVRGALIYSWMFALHVKKGKKRTILPSAGQFCDLASDAEFFKTLSVQHQGCCKVLVFCTQSEWLLGEEPVGQNKHSVQNTTLKC